MKHYSEMSIQECQAAETVSDRLDNLRALLNCLNVADECAQDEGIYLHGNLQEMRDIVKLAMRQIEDEYLA